MDCKVCNLLKEPFNYLVYYLKLENNFFRENIENSKSLLSSKYCGNSEDFIIARKNLEKVHKQKSLYDVENNAQ